jgi:hypothetical protein
MLACRGCGVRQERWRAGTRESTNIDPVSRLCVDCLAKQSKTNPLPEDAAFDFKRAQSKDGE